MTSLNNLMERTTMSEDHSSDFFFGVICGALFVILLWKFYA